MKTWATIEPEDERDVRGPGALTATLNETNNGDVMGSAGLTLIQLAP
jgi:hypothetical protein